MFTNVHKLDYYYVAVHMRCCEAIKYTSLMGGWTKSLSEMIIDLV
jgi:hypothetical protein